MQISIFELFRHNKTLSTAKLWGKKQSSKAFVSQPPPILMGSAQKGLHIAAGNYLINNALIKEPDTSIWDVLPGNEIFQKQAHEFQWLDHLAANGSDECIQTARQWLGEWHDRFMGRNPDIWTPQAAGSRVIRLVNHALIFLANTDQDLAHKYFSVADKNIHFLNNTNQNPPKGLATFHALVGRVYGALAMEEYSKTLAPNLNELSNECAKSIDETGGINTRNPNHLFEILCLLIWIKDGLNDADHPVSDEINSAIFRISNAIQWLRLGDGTLTCFGAHQNHSIHEIDTVLRTTTKTSFDDMPMVMEYSRLRANKSLLFMDTGVPEFNQTSAPPALAMEFSSGSHPVFKTMGIVEPTDNIDQTASFTHRFCCAEIIDTRVKPSTQKDKNIQIILDWAEQNLETTSILSARHSGYKSDFGLDYTRTFELSANGCTLFGLEKFTANGKKYRKIFDTAAEQFPDQVIPFHIRFHLDPDIDTALDLGDTAVSLQLQNKDIWVFKADNSQISLEHSQDSVFDRLQPRATKQIVVTSKIVNYEGHVKWVLAKM